MTIQPPTHRHPVGDAGRPLIRRTLAVPPARAGGQRPAVSPPRASVVRALAPSRRPARELYRICGEREFMSLDACGQACAGETVVRGPRQRKSADGASFGLGSDKGGRRALRAGCVALLGGVIGGLAAVVLASAPSNVADARHRGAARISRVTILARAGSLLVRPVRVRSVRLARRVDPRAVARASAHRGGRLGEFRGALSASSAFGRTGIDRRSRRLAAPEPARRDAATSLGPLSSAFARPLPAGEPAARRERAKQVGSAPRQRSGPVEFGFER
jgi:hypothetical protein